MKKLVALLMMVVATSTFAMASDDHPVKPEELPKEVKTFLNKHFADQKISLAKMEKELWGKEYKVYLVGGSKIEFGKNNQWKEIDCEYSEVPASVIPQQIKDYVKSNFPERKITQIEKKDSRKVSYEIELDNSVEIKFNKEFTVVDIDY